MFPVVFQVPVGLQVGPHPLAFVTFFRIASERRTRVLIRRLPSNPVVLTSSHFVQGVSSRLPLLSIMGVVPLYFSPFDDPVCLFNRRSPLCPFFSSFFFSVGITTSPFFFDHHTLPFFFFPFLVFSRYAGDLKAFVAFSFQRAARFLSPPPFFTTSPFPLPCLFFFQTLRFSSGVLSHCVQGCVTLPRVSETIFEPFPPPPEGVPVIFSGIPPPTSPLNGKRAWGELRGPAFPH